MMDFITIPLVVGTITLGIYKLFELFVCKKERIAMIEKLADRVNTGEINSNLSLNLNYSRSRFTFGSLKSGLLMLGIGLGLLGRLLYLHQLISGIHRFQKLGRGTSGKCRVWRMCTSFRWRRAAGSFPHRDENTEEREGIKYQNPPKPHLQRCNFGDLICSH